MEHVYARLFVATAVVVAAYWFALILLHFRVRAVGREGMVRFSEVKFLAARPDEQLQMLRFLFIGTHEDALVRALRTVASLLLLGLVMFTALIVAQVAG